MTLELFADNPVVVGQSWSTLSAPYTAGATALPVVSNTPYPAADPSANPATVFRVRVDNEILLVTDNRTSTWTVAGAQEGSTAANHASGVSVFVPFTKGSVAGVLVTAASDATAKVATETTRATTAEAAAQAAAIAAAATDATIKANAAQAAAIAASQPLDSDLTAIAALTTTSFGRALLALADAAAGRTAFGLGTAATQASSAFDAAGLAAAAQAASQPVDSDLTAIAALTTTAYGRAFLALADAAAARTALALGTIATHDATEFLTTASAASTYAPLASPAMTGTPTVPTAAPGTNTTQAASTAFSAAAIAAQHTADNAAYVQGVFETGGAYGTAGGRLFVGPDDPAALGFTLTDDDLWYDTDAVASSGLSIPVGASVGINALAQQSAWGGGGTVSAPTPLISSTSPLGVTRRFSSAPASLGAFMEFVFALTAGTYQPVLAMSTGPDRGIFKLRIGTTDVATGLDGYTASSTGVMFAGISTYVVAADGNVTVRLEVTGKNASSSAFQIAPSAITLTRTA